jgi:hypothetical protein
MMVGAFQQDRVAETVAKPQVNSYGRKYIRQPFLTGSPYRNLLHVHLRFKKTKSPE